MPSDPEALRRTLQAQLRDIQLPEAVSWWPPAWGWWLLVIAVFVVVALVAWHYRKLRHGLRVRRAAVAAAATHYQEWRRTGNDRAYIDRANALVRQVAIATDGRNRVARLNGEVWVRYLDSLSSRQVGGEMRRCLGEERYRPMSPTLNIERLHEDLRTWAKSLRVQSRV